MFIIMTNCSGFGTGVSLGGHSFEPATAQARVRTGKVAVLVDQPIRRAGVEQLT